MGKAWVEGRGGNWGRVQGGGSRAKKGHLEGASHHHLGFQVSVQGYGAGGGVRCRRGWGWVRAEVSSKRVFTGLLSIRTLAPLPSRSPRASSQSHMKHTGAAGTLSLLPSRALVYGLNLGLCHTQTRDRDCLWTEHEQLRWEPEMKPSVCLCGPGGHRMS